MREEGPAGLRFCSGDLNLQSSGQKSCRQLITDPVRHVQMKLEPPGTGQGRSKQTRKSLGQHKSEGRNPRSERSPKSEGQTGSRAVLRFGLWISSRLAGFRSPAFGLRALSPESFIVLFHVPCG